MIRVEFNTSYGIVGAQRDVDGTTLRITFEPNRTWESDDRVQIWFESPAAARKLARELNRWATAVSAL